MLVHIFIFWVDIHGLEPNNVEQNMGWSYVFKVGGSKIKQGKCFASIQICSFEVMIDNKKTVLFVPYP